MYRSSHISTSYWYSRSIIQNIIMSSQNWLQSTHKFHRFEIIFGTADDDRSKLGTTGRIYSIGTAFGFFEQTTIRAIVGSTDRPTHRPTHQPTNQRLHQRSKQKVTMINAGMWSEPDEEPPHIHIIGVLGRKSPALVLIQIDRSKNLWIGEMRCRIIKS